MCIHVLNAQVTIQCATCKGWYQCGECHDAQALNHAFTTDQTIAFTCKACGTIFQKNMAVFDEADRACPTCGNVFVRQARTPEGELHAHVMALLDADLASLLEGW